MRSVGLHIRITQSLLDVAAKAQRLELPFFQCFFLETMRARMINPTQEEIAQFLRDYRDSFGDIYLHGSYWINLAGLKNTGHQALYREVDLACTLKFTHLILHPGSAVGARDAMEGIDALARAINGFFARYDDIKLVLENVAHGGFSVGGDWHDFALLLPKIDKPERLFFCIDTAHAYSFGYDISTSAGQNQFLENVEASVGLKKIVLIHLNDTQEKLGSHIDRHALFGEGAIGYDALKKFALHPTIAHVPLLLELPIISETEELKIVNDVRSFEK